MARALARDVLSTNMAMSPMSTTPWPARPRRAPTGAAAAALISPDLARARALTRALDRYMLDPILGFFLPGAGDLVGSLVGLYLVAIAVRQRMSPVIIARMLLNLALDAALGVIPIAGDIADFAFKANAKNLALLEQRHTTGRATARDWMFVAGALVAFAGAAGLVIYAIVAALRALT
jgi:hypothetical protein